jgi:hypothetical protein
MLKARMALASSRREGMYLLLLCVVMGWKGQMVNSISENAFVTKFTHLRNVFGKFCGTFGMGRVHFLATPILSRLYKGN